LKKKKGGGGGGIGQLLVTEIVWASLCSDVHAPQCIEGRGAIH